MGGVRFALTFTCLVTFFLMTVSPKFKQVIAGEARMNQVTEELDAINPRTLDPTFIPPTVTNSPTPTQTQTATHTPTRTPANIPTQANTSTPEPTNTPVLVIVQTETPQPIVVATETQTAIPLATVPSTPILPTFTPTTPPPTPLPTPSSPFAEPLYLPLLWTAPAIDQPLAVVSYDCEGGFEFIDIDNNQLLLTQQPRQLGVIVSAGGYAGQLYATEWVINGFTQPDLFNFGLIDSDTALIASNLITLQSGTDCGELLPGGSYRVNFYIDGELLLAPTIYVFE